MNDKNRIMRSYLVHLCAKNVKLFSASQMTEIADQKCYVLIKVQNEDPSN